MNAPHLEVSFMPWAGLYEEIELGSITFWPFSARAEDRIVDKDKAIREHLEKYFQCYVDHEGHPVETVTICSHGLADFRQLSRQEEREIRAAVDALIFSIICSATKSAVCANKKSIGPPSAERYQLITQNFRAGDGHIAVRAGSVLSGGWEIGQISFPMPWSRGGAFASLDSECLKGFSTLFEPAFPTGPEERLVRSLEWFRLAHVESDDVSPLSKVVMMATAFEIILDVPNVSDKSGWVADEVAKRCAEAQSLQETRKDKKGHDQTRPKIAWWAWDFYKLRNAIVHGDVIESARLHFPGPERDWLTQLIVADLVFRECVMRELHERGCFGRDVGECSVDLEETSPREPAGSIDPVLFGILVDFSKVHRALGWLPGLEKV